MSDIQIIDKHDDGKYQYLVARVGKIEAGIFISSIGVNVCQNNASHRAWKKQGRRFKNLFQAREAYKSDSMRCIIEEAIRSFVPGTGSRIHGLVARAYGSEYKLIEIRYHGGTLLVEDEHGHQFTCRQKSAIIDYNEEVVA